MRALVGLIEAKDSYTALHSKNVCTYATQIARQLHMTETEIFQISLAALLHDLGKLKIPLQIINKPGRLRIRSMARDILTAISPERAVVTIYFPCRVSTDFEGASLSSNSLP